MGLSMMFLFSFLQATAEQMQIARIIESHRSEDPELQKKIKKIIEITGSSIDEASMALHSRDNNLEDAITLLTEGGTESLELEWEQAGKKKKVKNAAQKADAVKEVRIPYPTTTNFYKLDFCFLMNFLFVFSNRAVKGKKMARAAGSELTDETTVTLVLSVEIENVSTQSNNRVTVLSIRGEEVEEAVVGVRFVAVEAVELVAAALA